MFRHVVAFAILAFIAPGLASRSRGSFQHFFPAVSDELTRILAENCSSIFESYRNERITLYGTYCVETYSCIMQDVSEYTKANMASSTVLLGLTPWILSALGSSTSEMSLVSSRRPLLAFLLVLGSPAINPTRAGEYRDPFGQYLRWEEGQTLVPRLSPVRHAICIFVELVLAAGNIVNLGTLSRTLALNTIPVMSCDSDMIIGLWIALAIFTHILGLATFFTRAEFPAPARYRATSLFGKIRVWMRDRHALVREFHHGANQPALELKWGRESWKFIVCSWVTTVYTITHLAFGTLVLSSLSFVGITDATIIAARFGASAIVCRNIVAYELAGMKTAKAKVESTIRKHHDGHVGAGHVPSINSEMPNVGREDFELSKRGVMRHGCLEYW